MKFAILGFLYIESGIELSKSKAYFFSMSY